MTRFIQKGRPVDMDKVYATIYIHQHANKPLARICIAHEMYHLLLELEEFLEKGRGAWPKVPGNKLIEDQCNQFAWELCRKHDQFNRDDGLRQRHMIFPDGTFDAPLKTNDHTDWVSNWPKGIALDPFHPFDKSKCE
ncbi:MAG: hypothetical protein ACREE6_11300 [Limisphaerales bacterium]